MAQENQRQNNMALVSYVSPELLARVREDAQRCNRSVAGQVRELLTRAYTPARPKHR